MDERLTPQQAAAVENRGGMLLVSAAAGSGKTKVLVDRLLGYLERDGANMDEFLIITYTNAAASELRGKIAAKLSERIAQEPENRHLQRQLQRLFLTEISTVHGFCGNLLREYAYRLDIPADFRVADENECGEIREGVLAQLLEQAYSQSEADEDFLAFVDSQGLGRDDKLVPELIDRVYDSSRCHLDPERWLEQCLTTTLPEQYGDAANTPWGACMVAALTEYTSCQRNVMNQCAEALEACPGMEKPAAVIRGTVDQLDTLAAAKTWEDVRAAGEPDFGRLSFPRRNPDPDLTERVKAAREACKKGMKRALRPFSDDSAQIMEDLRAAEPATRGLVTLVHRFGKLYDAAKRARRVLDFSDLEQKTLDLLLGKHRTGPTAVCGEIAARYREVLVDEYQDSNGVQDAIFSALTRERQNCFLVGDVKQSIYQFRLADPGIFLEKYSRYVPAEEAQPGQGRKILLSHNFRSGPEIIEAVNAVFGKCMRPSSGGLRYTQAEALQEGVPHQRLDGPGVELYALQTQEDTYAEEAEFTAHRIEEMLRQGTPIRSQDGFKPVREEDIVILLRSPGSAGEIFRTALERRGIRCFSGGGTDLLQTEEIGTLRAFLQIIQNPQQDIPLLTVLCSPVLGFTADELAEIRGGQKKGSIFDALLSSRDEKSKEFIRVLAILRREARMVTLTELLESCFRLTRLDSVYAAMDGGSARSANLHDFYQLAGDYEQGGMRDLSQFLSYLDSLGKRGLNTKTAAAQGAVTIMSIHKSKGLEFPVVFLCNLSRKFNQESLHGQILCDKTLGLGLSAADTVNRVRYPTIAKRAIAAKQERESVSEEMRVLYVAMTRAKDRLIMTYAAKGLENDLRETALRMDFDGGELLCRDACCPGDWVLLAAMGRTEAGELHALGGRPLHTEISDFPWRIRSVDTAPADAEGVAPQAEEQCIPEGAEERLRQALSFRYPHEAATRAPSKRTATDRKGREKDAEAAQDTQEPKQILRAWRKPEFRSKAREATAYGSAIHLAMQYIRYAACGTADGVGRELERLTREGFLTQEQSEMVDREQIAAFFRTEIGAKLIAGTPCLREFKFSILDSGSRYGEGLEDEQVLLQGVVDCALLEEDGITVIDFKTDRITEDTVSQTAQRYRPQVEAYAEALERIYEKKVIGRLLYFFRIGKFVPV